MKSWKSCIAPGNNTPGIRPTIHALVAFHAVLSYTSARYAWAGTRVGTQRVPVQRACRGSGGEKLCALSVDARSTLLRRFPSSVLILSLPNRSMFLTQNTLSAAPSLRDFCNARTDDRLV
ncbi:hypothetical protein OG21DRAFT_1505739 [Imleria badia]|nr:hypothetical protein OG21DRAFT_1505739 [Imleria badia]